jgi:hypothetical protein
MSIGVNTLGLSMSEGVESPLELLLIESPLLFDDQLLSLLLGNRLSLKFKSSSESREYLVERIVSPFQEFKVLSQLGEVLMCLQPLMVLLEIIKGDWRDPKDWLPVV